MQRSRCSATRLVLVEHWLLWFQQLAASAGPTTDANRGLAIWTCVRDGQSNQVKYGRRGLALASIRRLTALEVSFVSGSRVSTTLAGCGSIVDESARPRIQAAFLLESTIPAKSAATLSTSRPVRLLRERAVSITRPLRSAHRRDARAYRLITPS